VRYVHEPSPGIVAGRNRALDEAATAAVLVFVDDDERPSDAWLGSLLGTYLEHRPGGVVGPIRCVFDAEPEPWVRDGGFFDRRRMPTGSTVDVAATNNLLLDLATVRGLGLRFDERYSRIGGSDHLFTRRLVSSGAILLWNNEAVVDDLVPAQRTTRQWVRRRQYRIGTSASLVDVDLARRGLPRAKARLRFAGQGLTRVGGGALRWAAGVVTGSVGRRGAGVRNMWRGAGLVAGAFGRGYAEYRRTPVSAGALSAPTTPEVAA
jgi:glycosyltransferase involved in cell wall biosynthesis